MSGVVLSSGVRQNLLSLQSTADLLGVVQGHLATGRKVNTALDNPKSFFTAAGLNARANDLSNLLDDQGQSIQVLKAADQGITSISKLVDTAKGKATQALTTSDTSLRKKYAAEYTELLNQITAVAKDSGYNGKNLLGGAGNDLQVVFNEDNTNKLKISAIDYTQTSNLGLDTTNYTGNAATTFAATTASTTNAGVNDGEKINFAVQTPTGTNNYSVDLKSADTIDDVLNRINAVTGGDVHAKYDATTGQVSMTSGYAFTADHVDAGAVAVGGSKFAITVAPTAATGAINFESDSEINKIIISLRDAQTSLRAQASTFGTNLSTVQIRQDWTKSIVNTLITGGDKLTLADNNEEGASLLSLQTQQQLSSKALSLASQADQNVLRLLG